MIDGLQIQVLSGRALDPLRWAAALRPAGGLAFFDSALPHETLGRYSFVMADPFHRLVAEGDRVTLDGAVVAGDPFSALADLMARYPMETVPDLPPFQGGVAGSFGYGLRHHVERVPRHRRDDQDIPDLLRHFAETFADRDQLPYRRFTVAAQNQRLAQQHQSLRVILPRLDVRLQMR